VQTLVDPAGHAEGELLSQLGFQPLATLQFLHWEIAAAKNAAAQVDSRLTLVPHAGDNPDLLKQMLAESYVGTLDCPQLDGVRQLDDTIEGYQSVGEYRPELWSIVMWQGEPAGVLLINPYRETDHWELIYMGLAPEFRGLGLGRQLLEVVRREGRAAGIAQVLLAVDVANWPARQIYNEVGFAEWGTRRAYIRSLRRGLAEAPGASSQGL
jgi:ribosomal protein S18 acetylase RimI-like enzyme